MSKDKVRGAPFTIGSFAWRLLFTLAVVLLTFNPTGYSYVHWLRSALSPNTLGGFRGMGEGGTIGAPAAVANAVADALSPLGIEINELPVTPERLFRLIEAARAARA